MALPFTFQPKPWQPSLNSHPKPQLAAVKISNKKGATTVDMSLKQIILNVPHTRDWDADGDYVDTIRTCVRCRLNAFIKEHPEAANLQITIPKAIQEVK